MDICNNLLIRLDKISQESGWNVSKAAVHAGIIMSISTNESTQVNTLPEGEIHFYSVNFLNQTCLL